jgi:hypothetical protein
MNIETKQPTIYGTGHGRFTLEEESYATLSGRYVLSTRLSTDGTFREALSRLPEVKEVHGNHVNFRLVLNPVYSFKELKKAIAQLINEMVERQTGLKQYTRRYVIDTTTVRSYIRLNYQANVDKNRIRRLVARLKADEGVQQVNECNLEFSVFFHNAYVAEEVRANVLRIIEHTLDGCDHYLKV